MTGGVLRGRSWRKRMRSAVVVVALLGLTLPIIVVLPFRWIQPPTSAFMLRYKVEAADDSSLRHWWTDWDRISSHVAVAVIAAEDQRFFTHRGFDVDSIQEALADAERNGRLRGASTISQQVSKNLFLWPGRSIIRKGLEAYCTVFVELLWSKQRILEVYLNVAEFGPGVFGIAAASEYFFNTVPAQITADQAALLAAVLPNPKVLRVDQPSAYVRQRQLWIRGQMTQVGGPGILEGLHDR